MKYIYTLATSLMLGLILVGCNQTPQQKADWVAKKMSKKLELNEAQEKKLLTLKDALLDVRERSMHQRQRVHTEVKDLLLSDTLNEGKVRDLITQRQSIVDEEFPRLFPLIQDFHSSLSLEQKEELVTVLEKFKRKHGHGWRK